MNYQTTADLFFALSIGLIIGLERGWHAQDDTTGKRSAGIRSFALVGLLGGIAGLAGERIGAWPVAAMLLSVAALAITAYWRHTERGEDVGITTETALLVTFGLGLLAVLGFRVEAIAAATVAALLLRFKLLLHRSIYRLSAGEISATLQLLVLAAVVIPLLPNQGMGPWEAVNPRVIGLLVLLIAGVSYAGYFAVRMLGPHSGVLTTAVLGGLTSSTAVAIAFSQMARRTGAHHDLLGTGIALASATMAPRLLLIIAAVDLTLVRPLALPLAVLAVLPFVAIIPAWLKLRGQSYEPAALSLSNPLELRVALIYGALLTILIVAVRAAKETVGDTGVYSLAALSGLANVDAVAISLAQARESLTLSVAALGIVIAAVVNTLVKGVIAWTIGGPRMGGWTLAVLLPASLACMLSAWMVLK